MKTNKKADPITISLILGFVVIAICEIFKKSLFSSEMLYTLITRMIGGTICFLIIYKYSAKNILKPRFGLSSLLFCLPCFAVAINNFRFIPFFKGEAYVDATASDIVLFALMCFGVGLFEEMAFRGCIFMLFLKPRRTSRREVLAAILISSAIFGGIHLTNLFAGFGNLVAVLQQIGYSFLIGAMCSVVLLKTADIWWCVVLHALFNFCGTLVPTLGGGRMWDAPTIIITVALAFAVTVYLVIAFIKMDLKDVERIFNTDREKTVLEGDEL